MRKAIWIAAAAAMLALPLAAGSAAAAHKSKGGVGAPVDSTDPAVQHDNNQIQKNTARAAAACADLSTVIFSDDPNLVAQANLDVMDVNTDLTNLAYLSAKKFDDKMGLPSPDPSNPAFQSNLDEAGVASYCGIQLGGGGGGGIAVTGSGGWVVW